MVIACDKIERGVNSLFIFIFYFLFYYFFFSSLLSIVYSVLEKIES